MEDVRRQLTHVTIRPSLLLKFGDRMNLGFGIDGVFSVNQSTSHNGSPNIIEKQRVQEVYNL
jgi:hypothetical protein